MSEHNDQQLHRTGRLTPRKSKSIDQLPSEIKPPKDADEVLGAIEGVEKQLESLRTAHEEHRRVTAELAARRAQIEEAADFVETREAELASLEVELAEMRQELEERESEIVQRASGLEQRESQLAQHAESIEELEAVVQDKSNQIDQRVEELDKQLEGISKRKDELAVLEQQARERIEKDNELEAKLEEITAELSNTKATLGGREVELKDRAKAVEELSIQVGLLEQQLQEQSEKALADEDSSLRLVEEMQASADEAEQKIAQSEEAMQRALSRIDELEATTSEQAKQIEQAQQTIAEFGSIEASQSESIAKIEELKAQLASAPSADQIDDLQSKLTTTTEKLESAQTEVASLKDQLNVIGQSATQDIEQSSAKIDELTQALGDANKKLEQAELDRTKIESELNAKLEQAIATSKEHQNSTGAHQATIDELKSQVSKRDEQIEKIRAKYDQLSDQLLQQEQDSAKQAEAANEAAEQINRLGELLDAAATREQELSNKIEELQEQMSSAASESASRSDEWTQMRRERLDKVKGILRAQSDKVRRATEALRDRYDQCEKVLQKRSELVEAYQAVADAQSKLAKREARSGTLLGLSGLGLLLMMIAGISWFVAGQVKPGQYASSVTVVAGAGERSLTADDLASWQSYIEQMIHDPQFIEQAASRMKRRGIDSLSVAGTLSANIQESLDIASTEPGKVTLEYRGEGAARTQRVLDTFAMTVTSQANAARARRIDGAMTTMESQAQAGNAPLDTARIETAGMIFGGSSFATFFFGGLFWRRLAKIKANFERDSRVEPLFDEDSWQVEGRDA